jgi:glycosyltransferase involved in cell wall biosynthesis
LKLLLNTESLRPPLTGIGNYTFNLLLQYQKTSIFEKKLCFNGSVLVNAEDQLRLIKTQTSYGSSKPKKLTNVANSIRKTARKFPGVYKLHTELINKKFGNVAKPITDTVYHEPNIILKDYNGPAVTTVHDLSFIHFPQYHPRERVKWLTAMLPKTLMRADYVITDSDVVRHDLIENFDVPAERIKTIYLGADEQFYPRTKEQVKPELSLLGLKYKSYLLFVGTIEPRKGVGKLLDAWCALPKSFQLAYPLVVAGSAGWGNSDLINRIKSLAEQGRIHYLNYVPPNMLPMLYSGAAVFVYPSVYEGFGLPVLEAMSSGAPVICQANTSMAEFAQGSCLLCETGEVEELMNKIRELLESPIKQHEYAKKGLRQAAKYSWQRCAKETADIYKLAIINAKN